ncbi:MAG TPA: DUF2851 family protein [Kiritimatiellia bacterium]|nr:DUF2851 family protein [Kiritimatiellia bacterium]HMP33104.1 DUF2851 family protein [Kiritimatiellia bacterium]
MLMDKYFGESLLYWSVGRATNERVVRESRSSGRVFPYSERHVQAVWFDQRWRPGGLITATGERVEVVYPGRWNMEAGPDFLDAVLVLGPGMRRIEGDVEVHVFPSGWRQHGHRHDPRYRRVVAHVTYFEGVVEPGELPPGAVEIPLRSLLQAQPGFAFEHLDVTEYPYAGRSDQPPCRTLLRGWPPEAKIRLLVSAGHARMRLKAERLAAAVAERGLDQVWYESVLAAMGYQHNKRAAQALAELAPLDHWRACADGDVLRGYAILAGLSGLLPAEMDGAWDVETRDFVRMIWDVWWREKSRFPAGLPRSAWRLHGIRPLNHPLRRLMGAARMLIGAATARQALAAWVFPDARRSVLALDAACHGPEAGSGPWREYVGGTRSSRPVALVGQDRLNALLLNVVLPLAAASGFDPVTLDANLASIKPEPLNQIMKQTAHYLFGTEFPSRWLASASARQGLMQVFHDYCLHDRSQCARCPFPGWLAVPQNPGLQQ